MKITRYADMCERDIREACAEWLAVRGERALINNMSFVDNGGVSGLTMRTLVEEPAKVGADG